MGIYIGPWIWDLAGHGGWAPPTGASEGIDLRPLDACASHTEHPANLGIFVATKELPAPYLLLAKGLDDEPDLKALEVLCAGLSIQEVPRAASLRELLADLLTTGADPDGAARHLPLMPDSGGMFKIQLGGELITSRAFAGVDDPAWPNVQAVVQNIYREKRRLALDPRDPTPEDLHQRLLTDWSRSLGISDVALFIPDDLPFELSAPTNTTLSDNFNRASLGADWTLVDGTFAINASTEAIGCTVAAAADPGSMRFEYDLSSANHYCQHDWTYAQTTAAYFGPCVRFASAAETFYVGRAKGTTTTWGAQIAKVVAGTLTSLWIDDVNSYSPTLTVKLQANGSTITFWVGGVQVAQITDTAITSGTRCGIAARNTTTAKGRGDNWIAEDLVSNVYTVPVFRVVKGMN